MGRPPRLRMKAARCLLVGSILVAAAACGVSNPPAFDPATASDVVDEYAKAFGTTAVRTKDTNGNETAEVHVPGHTIRQQTVGGRTVTTDQLELDFDWLAKQPGAKVVRSHDKDGLEITEFRRGGVVIRQSRRGNIVNSTDTIKADGASVLCGRLFLVVDLVALNECFPDSHEDIRTELRRDIEAMTRFISENSLTPLTLDQSRHLTSFIMWNYSRQLEHASPEAIRQACQTGELGRTAINDVPHWTAAEFRRQTDRVLRIPQPPIMCTGL
jgi:hypothetical protein